MPFFDNLSQQYGGFMAPFGFNEDEDAVGNAKPVTQTIKINPVTGEQTMTVSGRPQDLSAANPYTPTITMPGQQPTGAGGFLGGYEDMAPPQPQMAPRAAQPQMAPQPTAAGGFLGGYEDMAPAVPAQPAQQPAEMRAPDGGVIQPLQEYPRPATATQPEPTPEPVAAPAAPVAPPAMAAPPAPTAAAPAAAVAPGSDEYTQRMLAGLRAREGNYNTPPHAASSAQGAYGITAPAYSDVQRADPYFANRPQGQLTPEEQDRAALVLRGLNQDRLRSQGVEPTEANQQLAHFLGPKGAADYLKSGYISPEAAAANGGYEKVRQIAQERLAFGNQLASGGGAPAVAGVGREMGMGEPGYGGAGTMPAAPAAPVSSKTPWMDSVLNLQNSTEGLAAYIGNTNNPKEARDAASLILKSRYKEEDLTNQAQKMVREAIQTGDWKTLERLLKPTARQKERDEDGITLGGIAKAFLYSAIGFQSGAQDVVEKMGIGAKWSTTSIGEDQITAKFRKDGSAIEGQYLTGPKAGQELSDKDLKTISGAGNRGKVSTAAEFLETPDGRILRSQVDEKGNAQLIDVATGAKYTGSSKGLKPMREGVKMREMDYGLITALKKKHGVNVLDALAAFEKQEGPLDSNTRQKFLQLYEFSLAQPGGQQPGGQQPGGQQPGGQQPGGQQINVNKPIAQLEDERAGAKVIITEAAKQVAASADTQNMLNSINKTIGLIDTGDHNIGSVASAVVGRGPIAQAIGSQLETKDARNTKTIMDVVQKLAADGLKALGTNPSTVDLEFWTKFKPDASSDPEFVKDWIRSRSDDLKRRIGYAEKQVSSGGRAGGAPEVATTNEDTAALNWAKNNPDDPRAKRILELNRK